MVFNKLPKTIAVFPLPNAIFFPNTVLPLNIFEKRYIQLINDCLKNERLFGMVQPKFKQNLNKKTHKTGYGFDLVYNSPTLFLDSISKTKRIYGVEMLAHQAAPCFYKWFGKKPKVDKKLIKKLINS